MSEVRGGSNCLLREVAFEPLAGQMHHFIQRAGLFAEMSRAGNNYEPFFTAEPLERQSIQINNLKVIPANSEQRRRLNADQGRPGSQGEKVRGRA